MRKTILIFYFLLLASVANATTYYVDPAATGANDGTSWTNAWTTCQTAFDTAVVGDIVYLRGTETNTSGIDIDTQTGGTTTGRIKFIGVNASGTNDGTYFTLSGTGASAGVDGLRPAGPDYIYLENIRVTNYPGDGLDNPGTNGSVQWILNHCSFDHNGGSGVLGNSFSATIMRSCFYSNTSHGYITDTPHYLILASSFHDNGGSGYSNSSGSIAIIGSLFYGNTDDGIGELITGTIYNCVIDGNGDDGIKANSSATELYVIGSRITNQSGSTDMGFNANNRPVYVGWSYFENNDGDNIQSTSLLTRLGINGTDTNVEDASNSNQGYTSLTNDSEDFNLNSTSSIRRQSITVPLQ